MSNFPTYIVLATDPKDHLTPEFTEGHYQHCEWVIFDGALGEKQVTAQAKTFREIFHEVQVREVGKITGK